MTIIDLGVTVSRDRDRDRFGRNGRFGFLLEFADSCGHGILEALRLNVCGGDRVSRCRFNSRTRCNIFERALCERHACDFRQGDRPGFSVDVRCFHREGHGVADMVCLIISSLRHHQVVIHRFRIIRIRAIRHRQGAVDIGDRVARGHIGAGRVDDLRTARDVVAAAHQGLRTGHSHALDRIAFSQCAGGLAPAAVGQGCAVIDLAGAVCRDRDRDRFHRDGRFRSLLEITDFRRHRVREAARRCVCRSDRIGGCRCYSRSRRNIRKRTLFKRHAFDFRQCDRPGFIVNIRCRHRKGHGIANMVCLSFGGLRHHQVIFHRFIGRPVRHRQCAVGIGDHVARGHVGTVRVDDLRTARDVIAAADQGLGPGHGHALDRITFGQCARQLIAVFCQRLTVVDLAVAVSRDRDRDRFGRDGRFRFLLEFADCRGHGVLETARRRVCRSDRIGRCRCNSRTRFNIFERALFERHDFDFRQGDRPGFIVDVCRLHGEGHGITDMVCLIISGLRHHQVIIHRFIGRPVRHRQRAEYSLNIIVGRKCSFIQCICEGIFAAADQGLAAGHIIGRPVAFREPVTAYSNSIVRQRGSVIDLGIRRGSQDDTALRDRQRLIFIRDIIVVRDQGLVRGVAIGHRGRARDDLIGVGTGIGLFAGHGDAAERVAAHQAIGCHIGIDVRGVGPGRALFAAVIDVGLFNRGDGQGRLVNDELQLSVVGFIIGNRVFRDIIFAACIGQRTLQLQRTVDARVSAADACCTAFTGNCNYRTGRTGRKFLAPCIAGHGVVSISIFRTVVGLGLRGAGDNSRQFRQPDRVEIFQRRELIRGDLKRGSISGLDEQFIIRGGSAGTGFGNTFVLGGVLLCPAEEGVAIAARCRRNRHSIVDADIIISLDQRILAFSETVEPPDVSRGLFFRRDVFRAELNGVGIPRFLRRGALSIFTLRVAHIDGEGLARFDVHVGIFIFGTVPFPDDPVREDLSFRRRDSRGGTGFGLILIEVAVFRSAGAAVQVISDPDSGRSFNDGAPLGVEVQLLRDPRTVHIRVGGGAVAPLVHRIREIGILVVAGGDRALVQDERVGIERP